MSHVRHAAGARGALSAVNISAFCALFLLLPLGCGSSSRDDIFGGGSGAGGQPIATGGAAGSGGAATGGASGAGGSTFGTCRDVRACPTPAGQVACCTNDFQCGLRVGTPPLYSCVTPDLGGTPNVKCPSAYVLDGKGAGCCRSNGTCGYTDDKYGTGCVDPAQLELAPGKPCPAL